MPKSKKERRVTLEENVNLHDQGLVVEPTMLTVAQLASRWNLNVKTVYAAISEGRVPALRFGRKRIIRISVAVVQALETQGRALPSEKL